MRLFYSKLVLLNLHRIWRCRFKKENVIDIAKDQGIPQIMTRLRARNPRNRAIIHGPCSEGINKSKVLYHISAIECVS